MQKDAGYVKAESARAGRERDARLVYERREHERLWTQSRVQRRRARRREHTRCHLLHQSRLHCAEALAKGGERADDARVARRLRRQRGRSRAAARAAVLAVDAICCAVCGAALAERGMVAVAVVARGAADAVRVAVVARGVQAVERCNERVERARA
jgi:Flp pilus assembly protein TadB